MPRGGAGCRRFSLLLGPSREPITRPLSAPRRTIRNRTSRPPASTPAEFLRIALDLPRHALTPRPCGSPLLPFQFGLFSLRGMASGRVIPGKELKRRLSLTADEGCNVFRAAVACDRRRRRGRREGRGVLFPGRRPAVPGLLRPVPPASGAPQGGAAAAALAPARDRA